MAATIAPRTTEAQRELSQLAVAGAAVRFIRALDAHNPEPGELGVGIERLRSAVATYQAALGIEDDS